MTTADREVPPLKRGGLCEIWPWKCPDRATLLIYNANECLCSPCDYWDGDCQGHPVCDEHGALLRIEKRSQLPRRADGPPFVVGRVHTLVLEASV